MIKMKIKWRILLASIFIKTEFIENIQKNRQKREICSYVCVVS